MASLSELLNPAPTSKTKSPGPEKSMEEDDAANTSNPGFAPELFQIESPDDSQQIKSEEHRENHELTRSTSEDRRLSVAESMFNDLDTAVVLDNTSAQTLAEKAAASKRAADKKDSRHSSKNEGQHTDRRYLCYLCNKLFTRRRSVRDHLAKIHNTKTWEPSRSLEIVVEPESGEPTEPLEVQIARGGAAPAPAPRASKKRTLQEETIEEEQEREPEPELDPEPEAEPDQAPEKIVEQPTTEAESAPVETRAESTEPTVPAPVIGKKRPLPINKKGMAKVKTSTPNKRPRLVDPDTRTAVRSPSIASAQRAPSSKLRKATESPVSSRAHSVDASPSPSSSAETPESTNDDGEVFCICRKGDNHTWMIACDGGCEEWYHGGCVNIRERDGDLIDKYVCPKCTKAGFHTTWKRMCRRKGCRKPAKVFEDPPSKYCSRECGRLFFVDLIKRGDESVHTTRNGQYLVEMEKEKKKRRRRHKAEKKKRFPGDVTPVVDGSRPHTPAYSDDDKSDYETDSSLDEETLPNRGGSLRAGEVKAILEQCKTIDDWRELGRKPATPPREPDAMELDDTKMNLDDFERTKLATISEDKTMLMERSDMLVARETLLELIKKRSTTITEEVKKTNPKQKDLCGYDPRLAWSETEFRQWWKNEGGIQALESGKIGPPSSMENETMTNGHVHNHHTTAASEDEDASGNSMPTKGGVCVKNRCQRHGSNRWQKAQLAELRFEQDLVRRATAKLELEERDIRGRASVKTWSASAVKA